MPERVEQSLADGVSVRNRTSDLWVFSRVMTLVLHELCFLVFLVFCVMRVSSDGLLSCSSTSCCNFSDCFGLVGTKCGGIVGGVWRDMKLVVCWDVGWLVSVGIVRVPSRFAVGVKRTGVEPRLWMLCKRSVWVGVVGWSATGRDCRVMSGQ